MVIHYAQLIEYSQKEHQITVDEVRHFIKYTNELFRDLMIGAGHNPRQITRLTTKFRDAGRRSAPWRPTSSRVPGRPQDGADGNRINRWLLPREHKFYADEITATLVEIRFYFQALSMQNAPAIPNDDLKISLRWLVGHDIQPGVYLDPIQLIPINLNEVVQDASIIQSGHLTPLDRGGHHEPSNSYLMLKRSNSLQGNLKVDELLDLMDRILERHQYRGRNQIRESRGE